MILKNARWKKCNVSWGRFAKYGLVDLRGTLVEVERIVGRGQPREIRQLLIGDHFAWYAVSARDKVIRYKRLIEKDKQ